MSATTIPPPPPPRPGVRSLTGTALALLASASQVLAAFHHWHPDGREVALDVPLLSSGVPLASAGTALLVLAALPALAALLGPNAWPRLLSAAGTATLVLWWVSLGPVGPLATGVWLAAGAVCGHLLAAALAR